VSLVSDFRVPQCRPGFQRQVAEFKYPFTRQVAPSSVRWPRLVQPLRQEPRRKTSLGNHGAEIHNSWYSTIWSDFPRRGVLDLVPWPDRASIIHRTHQVIHAENQHVDAVITLARNGY
jgi:hypothetical protein